MASTREKGKIPHSEWPKILARYNGGETIASIGRSYACTAPAIRYIVKRSGMLKGEPGRGRMSDSLKPRRQRSSRLDTMSAGSAPPRAAAGPGFTARTQILGEELRKRVSGDVALFLVSLDQAVLHGSIGSIENLQEATDRLMRSTARTRLELERILSRYEPAEVTGDVREKGGLSGLPDA
jgi:hypothetical protein